MGHVLAVMLLVVLIAILWVPTFIVLLIRKSTFKQIGWFLFFEILIAVGIIAILDLLGATNPAGYMLVTAIAVSIAGFFYACFRRKK